MIPFNKPYMTGKELWNIAQAHASRAGNVGPGGRCDSIIDRYEVPCAEKTYAVYVDSYVCLPGTSVL
mgnify:CR=1 FL=1